MIDSTNAKSHITQVRHFFNVHRILTPFVVIGLIAHFNYFGEMLTYAGFAMLAQHWIVLLPLAYWWTFIVRNMLKKDKSMFRYPEFAEWKQKTGLVIPKLL